MEKLKYALSVIGGVIASFFSAYGFIILLVIFVIVIDVLTGLIKSKIMQQEITSKRGTNGFWKKTALFAGLAFGVFLDTFLPFMLKNGINVTLPFALPCGLIIGIYIVLNESISIAENLYACDVKIVPKWLIKILQLAKTNIDKGDNQDEKGLY